MQELGKILEEMRGIKDGNRKEKLYAKYPPNSKNQGVLNAYSQGYEDGTDNFYNAVVDIIRKHMNDGWIPVEERMPTQEECEDNWFWIAYGDSFGNSPIVARCEWVFADDENGNDASGSEFYIDQFPLPYKPSKDLIKAWKIIDIPAPYRPERSEGE